MARRLWSWASVEEEAKKYGTVRAFKEGSFGAYKWAERNGVLKDITAFMVVEVTNPEALLEKVRGELGSASRYAKVAKDMWEADPSPFFEESDDPEEITAGTYMDFEAQMYDQAGMERSDRALDHIEALQKYGTPEQVKEAWGMYLAYQTGDWEVEVPTSGIVLQGGEQGGSCG
jgi:hypothetical protein